VWISLSAQTFYAGVAGWTELQLADGTIERRRRGGRLDTRPFPRVLSVLGTVTAAPVGEGGRVFKDERMQLKWL